MFFPRLRNQAKWAFVLLIVVFAGGFVFLGVGSGGLDLGQLLRDAFGNKGSSGTSVSKAQEQVREHPRDAAARRKLARALESKGRTEEAIAAWTQYTALRPRDVASLRHLADLQLGQADRYFRSAQLAAIAQQEASLGAPFRPSPTGKFGSALGQDPIASALTSKASTQFQEASIKYQTAADAAIGTYKKIVKVSPGSREAVFSLAQAADTLHQPGVAIAAYRKLLTFDLDPAQKAQIRERIRTLRQSSQPPPSGG
jgi:tetratricopeptide (TPR) repeat protein